MTGTQSVTNVWPIYVLRTIRACTSSGGEPIEQKLTNDSSGQWEHVPIAIPRIHRTFYLTFGLKRIPFSTCGPMSVSARKASSPESHWSILLERKTPFRLHFCLSVSQLQPKMFPIHPWICISHGLPLKLPVSFLVTNFLVQKLVPHSM